MPHLPKFLESFSWQCFSMIHLYVPVGFQSWNFHQSYPYNNAWQFFHFFIFGEMTFWFLLSQKFLKVKIRLMDHMFNIKNRMDHCQITCRVLFRFQSSLLWNQNVSVKCHRQFPTSISKAETVFSSSSSAI